MRWPRTRSKVVAKSRWENRVKRRLGPGLAKLFFERRELIPDRMMWQTLTDNLLEEIIAFVGARDLYRSVAPVERRTWDLVAKLRQPPPLEVDAARILPGLLYPGSLLTRAATTLHIAANANTALALLPFFPNVNTVYVDVSDGDCDPDDPIAMIWPHQVRRAVFEDIQPEYQSRWLDILRVPSSLRELRFNHVLDWG